MPVVPTSGMSMDRVWKVDLDMILDHIASYNDPGYSTPDAIANWPANDDVFGDIPFVDLNGDSIYEPSEGEYPKIYGDQAILFRFHNRSSHGPYSTLPGYGSGFPFLNGYGMAYGFDCPEANALNDAFFIRYHLRYFDAPRPSEIAVGIWSDLDVGNPDDDYIGSDVERHMYYAYNGDEEDESSGSIGGFGTSTAAHGVVVLKGLSMKQNNTDDDPGLNGWGLNDGVIDNERIGLTRFVAFPPDTASITGAPYLAQEYGSYMAGLWKDSTQISYGGNGYGGSTSARYMYPGDSDPEGLGLAGSLVGPWSEASASNIPGDRTGLGVIGPVQLSENIQTLEFEIAHVFAREDEDNTAVDLLKSKVDYLHSIYQNGGGACGVSFALGTESNKEGRAQRLRVFPNPTTDIIFLEGMDTDFSVSLFSLGGQLIMTANANQLDLSQIAPGVYLLKNGISMQRVVKQ